MYYHIHIWMICLWMQLFSIHSIQSIHSQFIPIYSSHLTWMQKSQFKSKINPNCVPFPNIINLRIRATAIGIGSFVRVGKISPLTVKQDLAPRHSLFRLMVFMQLILMMATGSANRLALIYVAPSWTNKDSRPPSSVSPTLRCSVDPRNSLVPHAL